VSRFSAGRRDFWWEGVLGETSEIVWFQYFSVYALALGSSVGLVGFLVAISSLVSTIGSSLGAMLAEKTRQYRWIVMTASAGARLAFLLMAIAPWLPDQNAVIGTLVLASLLKGFGTSFALPSWTAFAAAAVSPEDRTRFFAFRNFGRQTVGFILTPLAGLFIGEAAGMQGWQVAWFGSFVIGLIAVYFFARVPAVTSGATVLERPVQAAGGRRSLRPGSVLFSFVVSAFVFQISVMLVGPFFAVYLLRELDATPFWVGMTAAASPLSAALIQAVLSRLALDIKSKPMLIGSNLGIVTIPLAWLFVSEPWHVCAINLVGGGLWATSMLATFNLLLVLSPEGRLPTFAAVHQGVLSAASFLGPLLGGFLIPVLGFKVLLVISAAGRLLSTSLLVGMAAEPAEACGAIAASTPRKPRIVQSPALKRVAPPAASATVGVQTTG
jgi:MFS family permease